MTTDDDDRIVFLLKESKAFFAAVGVDHDLMFKIFRADTDWEFILKIDALLETAVKAVIKKSLGFNNNGKFVGGHLDEFIEALPVNGRTSLVSLLKKVGCPDDMIALVEAVRRLRNGFAHDIRQVDFKLIEVIKARGDKASLLRGLSSIANYKEGELIKMYEDDGKFLRFGIVDGTLRFLVMAYHAVLK